MVQELFQGAEACDVKTPVLDNSPGDRSVFSGPSTTVPSLPPRQVAAAKQAPPESVPGFVVCLNQDRGQRVAARLEASLGGAVAPIVEFMGTDGREATRTGLMQTPKRLQVGLTHSLLSVPASDAITDSHMRAWEYFLSNTDAPAAAFFEDDAFVEDSTSETEASRRVRGALSEIYGGYPCDLLFLGHFESSTFIALHWMLGKLSTRRETETPPARYTREPRVAVGAHAYILTRAGAQKILAEAADSGVGAFYTSDFYLQTLASRDAIRMRVLNDRLVFQTSTASSSVLSSLPAADFAALSHRAESSATSNQTAAASWLSQVGIKRIPSTHFPTLLCDVAFGALDADKHVSARYIMAFEVARLCRLPAFSITTGTILLVVLMCIVAAIATFLSSSVRRKVCLQAALGFCLVLVPDLFLAVASTAPITNFIKVLFHMFILAGPLLAIALCAGSLNFRRAGASLRP